MSDLYHLPQLSVLDVQGTDAAVILHNVTTNAVKTLSDGRGCETFVTDVRGKTLGHGYLYHVGADPEDAASTQRDEVQFRFVGAAGQSQRISQHLDKYTLREDAAAVIRDADFGSLVIPPASIDRVRSALGRKLVQPRQSTTEDLQSSLQKFSSAQPQRIVRWKQDIAGSDVFVCRTELLGRGTLLLLVPTTEMESVLAWLRQQGLAVADEAAYHQARAPVGFPWYGIDLDEKNLPQELDRDSRAISFTKGCYLGQETVARLDALGQVQRKLVHWAGQGLAPCPGATLDDNNNKKVGRLTSIARWGDDSDRWIALGYARRSHFEPGAVAGGIHEQSGIAFTAAVISLAESCEACG